MAHIQRWISAVMGAGLLTTTAAVARAEAPGVYYSWRSLDTNVSQCLTQAQAALQTQSLDNIEVVSNSIAGRSDVATAVFVCLENPDTSTTVMVIVSSVDDQVAVDLREALKSAF